MKLKLLFLSSNPHHDLSLDEEYRAVKESLVNHKDSIELIPLFAVRIDDLIEYINREKPNIIHFTGHGNKNGELLFTDNSGHYDELVSANSLKKLFSTEKEHIKLVFLNACHSVTLAKTIHEEINCVIGMNSQIKKATATAFAKTFYSSFVSGRTIKEAFNQAIVKLESSYPEEANTPIFLNRNNIEKITIDDISNFIENNTNNYPRVSELKSELQKYNSKDNELENIVFFCNNIYKKYKNNKFYTLKDISLTLFYGNITAVIGKNGSGKTTLLNIIAGRLLPTEGFLYYPEISIPANTNSIVNLHKNISYIPQKLEDWRGNLKDNLHFILSSQGIYGKENERKVDMVISQLSLEKYIDKKWNELSAGYKMRFTLAKVILEKPKLLIMDEPLANLDIGMQEIFLNDLKYLIKLLNHKISIIFVSHHINEVERVADDLLLLENGEVAYYGKYKNFNQNRTFNLYEVIADVSKEELENIMIGVAQEIKILANKFILYTSNELKSNDILNIFIKNKIEIKYFRNISTSATIFLEEK